MADLEILSPVGQSILQWNKCSDESVDNFDLSMGMNGQENGDAYMDHTFHTPSFGDEEFDIPPINLPPTTQSSDTNSSDVYGSTHPLSHQEQPTHSPPQQQPQQQPPSSNSSNNQQQHQQQQHLMSPPPQMSPVPPYSSHQNGGPMCSSTMTSSASTSPATMMTSFSPHHHHHHQQQQMQQQHQFQPMQQHHHHPQQQQQNPYGNQQQHQGGDMYMLQIAPGSMMPPQSVQFHVQQYSIPNYSNPMQQQQHMHMHHQVPQQHHPMQHHPYHEQQHMMGPPPRKGGPGSVGSSPPGSNHTSPGLETSEDSDDSGHLTQLMCGMKRPSPEPIERPPSGGKNVKKPKVQKKKKKRDPNEPQKPVSAYALFFRDTQAAIKGQNPNASFGEVSKIVASMWDGLDVDHKNVYKKKTEAAKKEYLKALAAYRASLVSKAANDQSDNIYGGPNPATTPSSLSPLQKKSPLLTSLMEGTPVSMNNQQQSMIMGQSPMGGVHHSHMHHTTAPPTHQILHQMLSPGAQQQQQMMMRMSTSPPPPHPMMQQHHSLQQQMANNNNNNNIAYTPNMSQQMSHPGSQQQQGMMQQNANCQPRNDNPQQQEWERDYCNNDCVVSHCRDVFSTWVASRPQQNSYASVK